MEDLNLTNKVPPNSIEAEQSVLGSMLLDKEAIIVALEILDSSDFYREAHKEIFEAIYDLFNRNRPVDLVTLTEELKNRQTLDAIGGIPYITSLASGVPIAANVRHYAEIVERKSILRKLIKASQEIIHLSYSSDIEVSR